MVGLNSLGAPEDYSQTLGAHQEQVGRNEKKNKKRKSKQKTTVRTKTFLLMKPCTPKFVKGTFTHCD